MENKEVIHKEKKHKFFIEEEGREARLKYKKKENIIEIHKTEVPTELRGKGLANILMEAVLNYAREYGFKVKPTCSFAEKFLQRHPEYNSLVLSG